MASDDRPISNSLAKFLNLMKILAKIGTVLGLHPPHEPISAVIDDGVLRPRTDAIPDQLYPARAGDLQFLAGYVADQVLVYNPDVGISALNTAHIDWYKAYLNRCESPLPKAALFNIIDCEFLPAKDKTDLFPSVLDRVGQHEAGEIIDRIARQPGLADLFVLVADGHRQLGNAVQTAAQQYAWDGQRGGYDVACARLGDGIVIEFKEKSIKDVVSALHHWADHYKMVPDNLFRRAVYYADWLRAWAPAQGQHAEDHNQDQPVGGLWSHYWALWAWSNREIWSGSERMQDLNLNREFVRDVLQFVLPTQLATSDSDFLDRHAAVFDLSKSESDTMPAA